MRRDWLVDIVTETPASLPSPHLISADWADCWQTRIDQPFETARQAAEMVVKSFPAWTYPLLVLRNLIVLPLGLKGTKEVEKLPVDKLAFFPVLHETQEQFVGGIDDRHLDFRIIVEIVPVAASSQILKLTTVIDRHGWRGNLYLATVLPFHRAIIKGALAKTALNRQRVTDQSAAVTV